MTLTATSTFTDTDLEAVALAGLPTMRTEFDAARAALWNR